MNINALIGKHNDGWAISSIDQPQRFRQFAIELLEMVKAGAESDRNWVASEKAALRYVIDKALEELRK